MKDQRAPLVLRYAISLASVAAAFALAYLVPALRPTGTALFLAGIMIAAWVGGMGPGLVATLLSVLLLDYFFVPKLHAVDLGPAVTVSLAVFAAVAILISSLAGARRRLEETLRLQNRRKSEFMAVLAHELRNFLAPISPALAALRFSATEDRMADQACGIIERQIRHMSRLTDSLLDFARIHDTRIRLAVEPLDLGTVLEHSVEAVRPMITARRHRLGISVPTRPLLLDGDATRLEQVFINLLNNAARYTDPGGSIEVVAEHSGSEVVVRVRDNGNGIAPEALSGIFDLFTQAENGSREGLGIGLSLVRGLVEAHGGSVSAHSAGHGRGSEFVVRLPSPAAAPLPAPVPSISSA
jgi:two-component system CheB/CheR fusion protein